MMSGMGPDDNRIDPGVEKAVLEKMNLIREMIKHEDELTNARITWLTTSQGLLFATLGVTGGNVKSNKEIVFILSFIGISTSISALESLHIANVTRTELKEWWVDWLKKSGFEKTIGDFSPPLAGVYLEDRNHSKAAEKMGMVRLWRKIRRWIRPWRILPILFGVTWLFLAIYVLFYA